MVLWGFHPAYTGPLGVVPIALTSGPLVETGRRMRERDGGWVLGIYQADKAPMELRDQCRQRHRTPAYLCDPTRPGPEDVTHRGACGTCAAYHGSARTRS